VRETPARPTNQLEFSYIKIVPFNQSLIFKKNLSSSNSNPLIKSQNFWSFFSAHSNLAHLFFYHALPISPTPRLPRSLFPARPLAPISTPPLLALHLSPLRHQRMGPGDAGGSFARWPLAAREEAVRVYERGRQLRIAPRRARETASREGPAVRKGAS
jgi:hypothetical protein